ncbi:MAG: CD225/dispanin family protein [Dysgonamonadaceae bacterium]|jgi:RsiW-degrading membrane proteinase PrsW (M82 family)|nr:CD225/dispanin family protein [Dysgonamonadaceae bacterium]
MFCPNCGKEVFEKAVVCLNCGVALTNQTGVCTPTSDQKIPKSWMVESILVTLFCCMPLGVIGLIYASGVESKFRVGDYEGARIASANARQWVIVSFVLGLLIGIIVLLYVIFIPLFLVGTTSTWSV